MFRASNPSPPTRVPMQNPLEPPVVWQQCKINGPIWNGVVSTFQTKVCTSIVPQCCDCVHSTGVEFRATVVSNLHCKVAPPLIEENGVVKHQNDVGQAVYGFGDDDTSPISYPNPFYQLLGAVVKTCFGSPRRPCSMGFRFKKFCGTCGNVSCQFLLWTTTDLRRTVKFCDTIKMRCLSIPKVEDFIPFECPIQQ